MQNSILIETAKRYAQAGLSVIPTCTDKKPKCKWDTYKSRIMSVSEIERHFAGAGGIGIVCGKVSRQLELLDFDEKGRAFESWFMSIPEHLAKKMVVEESPSGGKHVYYRVDTSVSGTSPESQMSAIPGNRKLAMTADNHVLIETRGEGGYVKCAPSEGYKLITKCDFEHIPSVSPLEESILIACAKELDERGAKKVEGEGPKVTVKAEGAKVKAPSVLPASPLDIAKMKVALAQAGWKLVRGGAEEHWERPGKNEHSTSATFNGACFYVFSSNAAPFEPNAGYSVRNVLNKLGVHGVSCAPVACAPVACAPVACAPVACASEVCAPVACAPVKREKAKGNVPSPAMSVVEKINPDLFRVPGFIGDLTDYTMATAPYPNLPLAFAGAITMLAHLSGRNFCSRTNLRTNIYMCALAASGTGKDHPRKVNLELAARLGLTATMADRFASAEGIEDALLVKPTSFFMPDEIDTVFAALREKDAANERIYGSLLQFFTSSDTIYTMRKKALQSQRMTKFDILRGNGIVQPHLTLLGTAIPRYFFEALSERSLQNGLLSRCIVMDAGKRGQAGRCERRDFPERVIEQGRALVEMGNFDGVDLRNLDFTPPVPEPKEVPETEAATRRIEEVKRESDELYAKAEAETERALWTRAGEKVVKFAMLYAISRDVNEPVIDEGVVEWAWQLIAQLTRDTLASAAIYVHDSLYEKRRQKVIDILKAAGGEMMSGKLLKRSKLEKADLERVIETMIECEDIAIAFVSDKRFKYKLLPQ